MSYLLDTNVLSELFRPMPDSNVLEWFNKVSEDSLFISVLTIGEIRTGVELLADGRRKNDIRIWLENDLQRRFEDRILAIDQDVANRWGRELGKLKKPVPAIDSLIAATAMHYDMKLVTRNTEDYNFPGLEVINPWV